MEAITFLLNLLKTVLLFLKQGEKSLGASVPPPATSLLPSPLPEVLSPTPKLSLEERLKPISVNYHFTRQCNYKCGFCFHTAKSPTHLPLDQAKEGLLLLKKAGAQKINFSGGEPFLIDKGRHLGEMAKFCKETLGLESVSIVSNGSRIYEKWFEEYGKYVDILAISCDSFDDQTNHELGRTETPQKPYSATSSSRSHSSKVFQIKTWCDQHGVLFKLNTVVTKLNFQENMAEPLLQLSPVRWKVFQCLLLEGENIGKAALRNASKLTITNEEFSSFLKRHEHLPFLVPEENEKMRDSYLILDEQMRFLDCSGGGKVPSESILEVGVERALEKSGFDQEQFVLRGGIYAWAREEEKDLSW